MQLVHWLTGNKMGESGETMAMLDSIFDALIQQEDTMLRDFAARFIFSLFSFGMGFTKRSTEIFNHQFHFIHSSGM